MLVRRLLALLCLAAGTLHAAPLTLVATNTDTVPQINVSGTAAVRVAPDEVLLNVGVETRHANLQEATRENAERVAKALALIRRHGVAEKDIQVNYLQVEPDYDYERSRTVPVAYRVQKGIGLKLTRLDQFEPLLTGLYAAGVNQVGDIEFRTSQLRQHRDRARELAVQAAREKADALTAQLGAKRGKALRISESMGWFWRGTTLRNRDARQQNMVQQAPGGGDTQGEEALAAGQINVTATVDVVFQIE